MLVLDSPATVRLVAEPILIPQEVQQALAARFYDSKTLREPVTDISDIECAGQAFNRMNLPRTIDRDHFPANKAEGVHHGRLLINIAKIQIMFTRLIVTIVWTLTSHHLLLPTVLAAKVHDLNGNQNHADNDGAQREPMTQPIRGLAIDLGSHDASNVAQCLAHAQRRCTTIVRSRVVHDPRFIESGTAKERDGNEVAGKVSHPGALYREENDVPGDGKGVADKDDGASESPSVARQRGREQGNAAEKVDWDAEVLSLQ